MDDVMWWISVFNVATIWSNIAIDCWIFMCLYAAHTVYLRWDRKKTNEHIKCTVPIHISKNTRIRTKDKHESRMEMISEPLCFGFYCVGWWSLFVFFKFLSIVLGKSIRLIARSIAVPPSYSVEVDIIPADFSISWSFRWLDEYEYDLNVAINGKTWYACNMRSISFRITQ